MRPRRYRLMPIAGVSWPAATYGSANYGDQTYGQAASDPAVIVRYVAVFDGGYPAYPAVETMAGDQQPPIHATLVGTDGSVLDLTPAASATLTLSPSDGQTHPTVTIPSSAIDITHHQIAFSLAPPVAQLMAVGAYKAVVHVLYLSGRTLSAPSDMAATFVVADGPAHP